MDAFVVSLDGTDHKLYDHLYTVCRLEVPYGATLTKEPVDPCDECFPKPEPKAKKK